MPTPSFTPLPKETLVYFPAFGLTERTDVFSASLMLNFDDFEI